MVTWTDMFGTATPSLVSFPLIVVVESGAMIVGMLSESEAARSEW
jgi:hypothetical protein